MPTILVTGAAGFIGSHTCDLLLAAGHEVVGVDNLRTGKRDNLAAALRHSRFKFCEEDASVRGAIDALCERVGPDAIVHLAALVSVPESISDPAANFRLNVEMTQHVIEAARRQGVRRIVFASSAAIYGDNPELPLTERSEPRPISPYGGAKLASEALLFGHGAAFGITVRCLRYFNVYGPRQDPKSPYSGVISIFADRLKAGAPMRILGDGQQTRDFVSVFDVARANLLAATSGAVRSGAVNICTGTPTSLNELAKILRGAFPNSPDAEYGPPRAGDIRHSLGSPARAAEELGWKPEIALEPGLMQWLRCAPVES
jgi:UDP-glucose 4-epimerase